MECGNQEEIELSVLWVGCKSFFGERKRVDLLKITIFVVKLRNIDYVLSSSSKFVFTQGLCYVRFLEI